jgi:hypothetical protein
MRGLGPCGRRQRPPAGERQALESRGQDSEASATADGVRIGGAQESLGMRPRSGRAEPVEMPNYFQKS